MSHDFGVLCYLHSYNLVRSFQEEIMALTWEVFLSYFKIEAYIKLSSLLGAFRHVIRELSFLLDELFYFI